MNTLPFLLSAFLALACLAAPAQAKPKRHAPKAPAKSAPVKPARPAPWKGADIGQVGVPGTSRATASGIEITGSGEDIFGKADSFRYYSIPLNDDVEIVARVVSYQRRDQWTKVGVMVRESDAPGAKFADILLTPDHGAEFQWRANTDSDTQTSDQTPAPAPYWVKLSRTGDVFVGSISADGKIWTERGRATFPMAAKVLVGVCVTSHKNDTLTHAKLDNVEVVSINVYAR